MQTHSFHFRWRSNKTYPTNVLGRASTTWSRLAVRMRSVYVILSLVATFNRKSPKLKDVMHMLQGVLKT